MFGRLRKDIRTVLERDPAARNVLEVLFFYPGFHAVQAHRLAHWLHRHHLPFVARMVSHVGRFLTGIEIHPGARIDNGLFIDHGMGVVIGETAEVGKDVTIYQGAVLGGTGKERGKRHPTVGDNVVIAAGAKILGSVTVGDHAKVGAGAVVLKDVPAQSTVVGVPGRVVKQEGRRIEPIDLNHIDLPDPVERAFHTFSERVDDLDNELRRLRERGE